MAMRTVQIGSPTRADILAYVIWVSTYMWGGFYRKPFYGVISLPGIFAAAFGEIGHFIRLMLSGSYGVVLVTICSVATGEGPFCFYSTFR